MNTNSLQAHHQGSRVFLNRQVRRQGIVSDERLRRGRHSSTLLISIKNSRKENKNSQITKKEEKTTEEKNKKIKKKNKSKIKKNIINGIAYIKSTFNNTIISIADTKGNVVAWSSAGKKGFKGSRKSTPYAAQIAADSAASKALEFGMKVLSVEIKGPGSGRETALRALQARGFKIISIKDTTPMPHNGTRPPKKRRV